MYASFRRCFSPAVAAVLIFAFAAPPTLAEPPSILSIFRKKQPLSDESLELKAEHGPWLILAATLPGADAKQKAVSLAKEIRSEMNLPAFVMEKTLGGATTLATRERIRTDVASGEVRPYELEIRYANGGQETVYAVLVGEFTSDKDPRIKDTLSSIRKANPSSYQTADSQSQTDSSNWMVQKYRSIIWTKSDRKEGLGPMGAAMLTRNPLLPDDYFDAPKVDKEVAGWNKDVEHSLLECPGKFTVRVASFTGKQVTQFGSGGSRSSDLEEPTDALDKAAVTAHELTMALRREGEEAYEFHDRFGSYVMIGSFDSLGKESASGQFQYNPAILATLEKWCGYRIIDTRDPVTGAMGQTTSLKSLDRIPFDIDGKPMAVPRPATNNLYRGSLLGGR